MTDFTRKYFKFPSGREEWCITGDYGSLSVWTDSCSLGIYGGIEHHYNEKSKPEYYGDGSKHDDCMMNGGVCWHDGGSMWAEEYWIPKIIPLGDEAIWNKLEGSYDKCMNKNAEE